MDRLYSNLKFLGHEGHLKALKDGAVVAPVHVRIKPTNMCNHDCWYCAYRVSNLRLGEDMREADSIPPAKMIEIIDDLIAMKVQAVTFSGGGEPLLYSTLPDCIKRLAEGGIRVATLTNGANLRGRMADAFAQHGTWVRISLDAWDDASYVVSRSAPDKAFSRLFDNIRAFTARASRCVLGASFIIGHDNHRHIRDVCAMLRDAGANHVKLSGAVVGNDVATNNHYHRAIATAVAQEIAAAKELTTDGFTVIDHYHELEKRFDKEYVTCPFLMFLTVIGADCKVYTCQDKAYTDSGLAGSIAERRFSEFWFSEENRQHLFSFDPSQSCSHHCVAHAKNLAIHEVLRLDPDHVKFV
jgi:wyosine [tRNA(Phe)-imidazoG37] synthetase (radical SAM superfamily)